MESLNKTMLKSTSQIYQRVKMSYLIFIALTILQSCTFSLTTTDIEGNSGPVTETDSISQEPKNDTEVSPQFTLPADLLPSFMV